MILTGIDGGSRGNDDAGVLVGRDLRESIPFDKSPFELAGDLLTKWFGEWMKTDYSKPLDPIGWFTRGHLPGVHLWAPPLAADLVALKQQGDPGRRDLIRSHMYLFVRDCCGRRNGDTDWRRK